ncbi:MAG: hypothetical protein HY287_10575 [Planctomycetes bacterium]|nr:hypothetical protein [Planctomycetota bacterium]
MYRNAIALVVMVICLGGCTGQGVTDMSPGKLVPSDPSSIPAGEYKGTLNCTNTIKDKNGAIQNSQTSSGEDDETFGARGIPMVDATTELMVGYVKSSTTGGLSLNVKITAMTPSADGLTILAKANGSGSGVTVTGTSTIVYKLQDDGTLEYTQTNELVANSIIVSGVTDEVVCTGVLTPQE